MKLKQKQQIYYLIISNNNEISDYKIDIVLADNDDVICSVWLRTNMVFVLNPNR